MGRHARWVALTTATLTAFAAAEAAGSTGSPGPAARAAAACAVPDYPGSGYFTSLNVRRVGCRTGRRLALAYYRCRTRNGPAGRCGRARVLRYRCREVRTRIPTELNGRVTCRRGVKRVVHTYQQNL